MDVLTVIVAALAGLVLVAVGVFSVASLWWGDLLESDAADSSFSQAA